MAAATNTSRGTIKLAGDLAGSNDANNPQLTLSGVTAGVYGTNPTLTINTKGIITAATSGSAVDVFNIPIATATSYGIIKIGDGITVAGDGTASLVQASTTAYGAVKIASGSSGINVSSGVISVNTSVVPQLAGGFQYTGSVSSTPYVNTNANGTISLDFSAAQVFELTLTGPLTLSAPSNIPPGAIYYIVLKQDSTGSRTCTFDSTFKFESGTSTTLTTTANAIDVLRVTVSSIGLTCRLYKNFV